MGKLFFSKTFGYIRICQKPGAGSGSSESGSATPPLLNICDDRSGLSSGVPRQCVVCGELAEWECPDCYGSIESSGLQVQYRQWECPDCYGSIESSGLQVPYRLYVILPFFFASSFYLNSHCNSDSRRFMICPANAAIGCRKIERENKAVSTFRNQ